MFEGVRGPGYEGDIAIDDVSITLGKCKQDNTVASAGKTGKSCTVECRDDRGNRPDVCRSFNVPGEMNIYKYPNVNSGTGGTKEVKCWENVSKAARTSQVFLFNCITGIKIPT